MKASDLKRRIDSREFGCHWRAQECAWMMMNSTPKRNLKEKMNGICNGPLMQHGCRIPFVGHERIYLGDISSSLSDIGDIEVHFLENGMSHMEKWRIYNGGMIEMECTMYGI